MNILTWIVLGMIGLFTFRGYRKGLAGSIISSFSLILTVLLASWVTPYVAGGIENSTAISQGIMRGCERVFTLEMNEEAAISTTNGTISDIQNAMIDQLDLPGIVKQGLKSQNTLATYQRLGVKNFQEYVPKFIADYIVKALVFVISWLFAAIGLFMLTQATKIVTSLPFIKGANKLLGAGLGFVQGMLLVWVGFLGITMFGSTNWGAMLLEMIAESPVLEWLYDMNIVLHLIQLLTNSFI